MKWDCGPTWADRLEAQEKWHPHYAWWPCRVGSNDCRWLEWVERRILIGQWDIVTEYRAPTNLTGGK